MHERLSLHFLVWMLRLKLHRLDNCIYCAWDLPALAISFGSIIALSAKFVIEATPNEIRAVVEHEQAHKLLHRRRWYLPLLRTFAPRKFTAVCYRHEFEADAFVAQLGLAEPLISALSRYCHNYAATLTHPALSDRISRLQQHTSKIFVRGA
jgi:Zn-dependent protease with chaperone function